MIFIKIISFLPQIGPLWAHKGPMGIPRKLELSFGEGCILIDFSEFIILIN